MSGRKLKFYGGSLVLLSFLAQFILFDYWNEKSVLTRTAMLERAVVDKGAQLSELLYLVTSTDSLFQRPDVRVQKIQEAATKRAFSMIFPLAAAESLSREERGRLTNELRSDAAAVSDYQSFADFLGRHAGMNAELSAAWNDQLARIDRNKSRSRWLFIALYVIGVLAVLVGERREAR